MISDYKIEAFSRPVSDLADTPLISAGELKSHFDSNSYELLAALNGLIDCLSGDDSLSELKLGGASADEVVSALSEQLALKADSEETTEALAGKVDKVDGMGLSTNDYTDAEKEKLAGLENYDDTEIKNEIGDIETALDEIIAIQNSLIGGDAA